MQQQLISAQFFKKSKFSVGNRLEKNTGISNYLKDRADLSRFYIFSPQAV